MPYKESGVIHITMDTKFQLALYKQEDQSWEDFFEKVLILIKHDAGEI